MGAVGIDPAHWQRRLAEIATEHGVPGSALAVLTPTGDIVDVACGVLNTATGVPVTADSVFQIGSLTKLWTATLAVQFADEGRLDLDAPVAVVLPGLRLSDERAAIQITMRHLLTHSSGIDGDIAIDTGRGDDCVARYVEQLPGYPQLFMPGAGFSYSNAGFVLAGRVLEVLGAAHWDEILRSRLIEPLGLKRTSTLPEEALRWRTAMGHLPGPDGSPIPAPRWMMWRSAGPAARINSTAREVIEFARLHLDGGVCALSGRLVSASGVAAMQQRLVANPNPPGARLARGLGWGLADWDGHRVLQHNGETLGQQAFLRVFPDDRVAVVLLANGGQAEDLMDAVLAELLPDLAGIELSTPSMPATAYVAGPLDSGMHRYAGRYERTSTTCVVSVEGSTLTARLVDAGPAPQPPTRVLDLVPTQDEGLFACRAAGSPRWATALFFEIGGRPMVHLGGRAAPKVE